MSVFTDEQTKDMKMCEKAISNICQGSGCRHPVKHLPNTDCTLYCLRYGKVKCI